MDIVNYQLIGETKYLYQWTKLTDLENIISNINNIYFNQSAIFIENAFNTLYVAGGNYWTRLGLDHPTQKFFPVLMPSNI